VSISRIKRPNSNSGSISQFLKRRERMLHESCRPIEVSPAFPRGVMVTGGTYNTGRNAAKRAARLAN
jgi:hypothetical protein